MPRDHRTSTLNLIAFIPETLNPLNRNPEPTETPTPCLGQALRGSGSEAQVEKSPGGPWPSGEDCGLQSLGFQVFGLRFRI